MQELNPGFRINSLGAYLTDPGDERTREWLMMSSPWPGWGACAVYLAVIWLGYKYMEGRKTEVQVRIPLIVYNMAMVLLNGYMCVEIARNFWTLGYSFTCNAVNYTDVGLPMAKVLWWFYFSKFIEFLDTIFFVLRRRFHLITFLHVYHHTTMPLLWWIAIKWVPGGDCCMSAMVNSFVHVVMYTYYGLTAAGYKVWWKRYLTQLQLSQFFFLAFHGVTGLYVKCDDFPLWMAVALVAYMATMVILFGNFYIRAYIKGKGSKKAKANTANSNNTANSTNNNNSNKSKNE